MAERKTKKLQANGAADRERSYPTTGAYFLSLQLENVRCFSEKQVLDLSDGNGQPRRWTILLGENGIGKTTILQLLAIFHWTKSFGPNRAPTAISPEIIRNVINGFLLSGTLIRNPAGPWPKIWIDTAYDINRIDEVSIFRGKSFIEYDGRKSFQFLNPHDDQSIPICYAYGAGRRLGTSSLNREEPDDVTEGFLLDDARFLDSEEWLLRLDYSASKPSKVQRQLEKRLIMVKDVLTKILPNIPEVRFTTPTEEKPNPGVEFRTPFGWVPLRQLGYGYRTMIAWVVDLARRMVERYPNSSNPLAEPAVVLIDEIDLHLHPKWQRELIGFLTERFPNTQFIVTAHSPLIVQAATDANIALLKREGDHVVIENHPETIRGWRIDQVLTSDLFDLETARPPDMEKLILKRKELLTKPRLTKADKKHLEELDDQLGQIPQGESFEQAKKTMELIEKSLKLIEKYQGTKS